MKNTQIEQSSEMNKTDNNNSEKVENISTATNINTNNNQNASENLNTENSNQKNAENKGWEAEQDLDALAKKIISNIQKYLYHFYNLHIIFSTHLLFQ